MPDPLAFDLVSPEKMIMSAEVEMVTVPGTEGRFGVLANHAPIMSSLRPGLLDVVVSANEHKRIFVRGGFAEVTPKGLTVLAEEAISLDELDPAVLAKQIEEAQEDVADAKDDAVRHRAQETLGHLQEVQQALSE